jgi:hypothetical protein
MLAFSYCRTIGGGTNYCKRTRSTKCRRKIILENVEEEREITKE